jgi:hypothetical protein
MLQSKLDGAFAQYHNEVQEMQEKRGLDSKEQVVAPEE